MHPLHSILVENCYQSVACPLSMVGTRKGDRHKRIGPHPGGQAPPWRPNCNFFPTKIIISRGPTRKAMPKNTFLIRTSVTCSHTGAAFAETELDLGSYTNLGSSKPEVLRIHSAHIYFQDATGFIPNMGGNKAGSVNWQLTTSSQTGLVLATEDSFLMGGQAGVRNGDGATNPPTDSWAEAFMPQDLVAGQVVAVPSLFLGGTIGSEFTEDGNIIIILECTTEAMSKANAVALAVSQQ